MKQTHIHYSVQYGGGATIPDTDYSQYYKRLKHKSERRLRTVYGPRQAREHVKELRKFRHLGHRVHAQTVFRIVKVTTTTEVLATVKPKSNDLHRNRRSRKVQVPRPHPDKEARA